MGNSVTLLVNGRGHNAGSGMLMGGGPTHPVAPNRAVKRTAARNIDGFFRPRASASAPSVTRVETPPPVQDSIAELAAKVATKAQPVDEGIRVTVRPRFVDPRREHHGRRVNHTQARRPSVAHRRQISVDQTLAAAEQFTVHRRAPNHVHARTTQHSRTLRREAVPQPAVSAHNLLKPKGMLQTQQSNAIVPKKSVIAVDSDRLVRAQSVAKNPLVGRFEAAQAAFMPIIAPVPVQPVPAAAVLTGGDGLSASLSQPTTQASQPQGDLFEQAVANARHFVDLGVHRAQRRRFKRFHTLSMATGTLALVVIVGFVAWQNSPALQLRWASFRSGVSVAATPNFSAAGFTYNGVRAGDSRLTFGFSGDGNDYQLTQTTTNLGSADMLDTISATTASGSPIYTTVRAADGLTIYRFSNTTATWVVNGKWYSVSGKAPLSDQQVTTLAQHL